MIKVLYFVHGTTTDNALKLCGGCKEAMLNIWRKTGDWQLGWEYIIEE